MLLPVIPGFIGPVTVRRNGTATGMPEVKTRGRPVPHGVELNLRLHRPLQLIFAEVGKIQEVVVPTRGWPLRGGMLN